MRAQHRRRSAISKNRGRFPRIPRLIFLALARWPISVKLQTFLEKRTDVVGRHDQRRPIRLSRGVGLDLAKNIRERRTAAIPLTEHNIGPKPKRRAERNRIRCKMWKTRSACCETNLIELLRRNTGTLQGLPSRRKRVIPRGLARQFFCGRAT